MQVNIMKNLLLPFIALFSIAAIASDDGIHWQDWSQDTFENAKRLDRPLLINVGHEGCMACRWMKDETFTDPGIVELVNKHFIAIQVDSEMQPDIGEQYSDWAWPATAFNRPDGTQVLAIRGNRKPEKFQQILNEIIRGHEAGTLEPDSLAPYGAPEKIRDTPITKIRDQVRAQLDNNFDDEKGGWLSNSKILEQAEPFLDYAFRAKLENDKFSRLRFLKTANGYINHIDKVWSGVFYESFGNWDDMILEKRLETQAAALQLFSTAYRITGEQHFADALDDIQRYLNSTLRSESGLYFASQQANLPDLSEDMSLADYYQLDDKGRRTIGAPTIDHSLYTDLNARIISGLVAAYEATGSQHYLSTAIDTADSLVHLRKTKSGSFIQFKLDSEFRQEERIHKVIDNEVVYLRPHAYLGLAFVDLHRATANDRWLQEANNIITVLANLQDMKLGGYFGAKNQIKPRKPLEDNAVAARFMYFMSVLVQNDDYRIISEQAIRASAAKNIVEREGRITGNLALTTELLSTCYVEFSIVGDEKDPAARALYDSATKIYEPRKVQHYELPGRYPKRDKPAMYICSAEACSIPIFDVKKVATEARKFLNVIAFEVSSMEYNHVKKNHISGAWF